MLAAYLGTKTKFDRSVTDFSERYADQTNVTTERSAKQSVPAVSTRLKASN